MALPLILSFAMPQVATANPASTAVWAAAAAVIVGAIVYDGNHRPYYNDRYGRRHYVNPNAASYYQQHRWNQTPQNERYWQDQNGNWRNANGLSCARNDGYQNRGYQSGRYRYGRCNNGRGNARWQDQNGNWHNGARNGCC
jgi:hypothetical protein